MLSSSLETSFTQAQQLQAEGKITEAFMLYQHIFRACPNHIPTLEALIELGLAIEQYETACKLTKHLLDLDPGQPTYWMWLIMSNQLSAVESAQALRYANLPAKELTPLRIRAAKAHLATHQPEQAAYLIEQIEVLIPTHPALTALKNATEQGLKAQ